MGSPQIIYGGKTITLPVQRSLQIDVAPSRTTQVTLTGAHETLNGPSVNIRVQAEWLVDSLTLRYQLENWWQAAQRGETWALALDSAKTVDTRIAVDASSGATFVYVNDPSGITVGQIYRLIDGPYCQFITVSSLSADRITLTEAIDFNVGAGAIVRDQFYWRGLIDNDRTSSPIRLHSALDGQVSWPPGRFIFSPEFLDDISEETIMLFKALAANATGSDVNTAQPWFPSAGGITLAANTLYFFDGYLRLSRAAGTTSHTTSLLFGGTASLTSIAYKAMVKTGDTAADAAEDATLIEVATATVVKAASTSATEQTGIRVQGIVRVNASGTVIPQFQYSAAPGGVPTILANSYIRFYPEGAGDAVSRGTWS